MTEIHGTCNLLNNAISTVHVSDILSFLASYTNIYEPIQVFTILEPYTCTLVLHQYQP